jgi:hypothetical protein
MTAVITGAEVRHPCPVCGHETDVYEELDGDVRENCYECSYYFEAGQGRRLEVIAWVALLRPWVADDRNADIIGQWQRRAAAIAECRRLMSESILRVRVDNVRQLWETGRRRECRAAEREMLRYLQARGDFPLNTEGLMWMLARKQRRPPRGG